MGWGEWIGIVTGGLTILGVVVRASNRLALVESGLNGVKYALDRLVKASTDQALTMTRQGERIVRLEGDQEEVRRQIDRLDDRQAASRNGGHHPHHPQETEA